MIDIIKNTKHKDFVDPEDKKLPKAIDRENIIAISHKKELISGINVINLQVSNDIGQGCYINIIRFLT